MRTRPKDFLNYSYNDQKLIFNHFIIDFNIIRKLDETISIPMDKTKKPIILDIDFNPACPVYFKICGAIEKIA